MYCIRVKKMNHPVDHQLEIFRNWWRSIYTSDNIYLSRRKTKSEVLIPQGSELRQPAACCLWFPLIFEGKVQISPLLHFVCDEEWREYRGPMTHSYLAKFWLISSMLETKAPILLLFLTSPFRHLHNLFPRSAYVVNKFAVISTLNNLTL